MNLIISNSSSIAFAVSRALNCTDRTPAGDYTNDTGTLVITSVDADLVAPMPMQAYSGGSDFIGALPFIPDNYMFGIRTSFEEGKAKVSPADKAEAERVYALIGEASEVVFASNGGAYEQARFSILCRAAKAGQRISRMWLTTISNKAIVSAYRHREASLHLTRIARSGLVHLGMDFLFRTNVEQSLAQAYGKSTFALDRMDVAALWLLCNSYDQHRVTPAPKHTFSFQITGEWEGKTVEFAPAGLWHNAENADRMFEHLKESIGRYDTAEVVNLEMCSNAIPKLFTMASLQIAALDTFGFMPERTMAAADLLFEKGLISSPRTSVSDLPKHISRHLERRLPEAKGISYLPDEEIPYCHGIITTERSPLFLSDDEQRIYKLINDRMKSASVEPETWTEVGLSANIQGVDVYGTMKVPAGFIPENNHLSILVTAVSQATFTAQKPEPLTASEFLSDLYSIMESGKEVPQILPMSMCHDCGASFDRLVKEGFVKVLLGEIKPTEKTRVMMAHTEPLDLSDIGAYIGQLNEVDALADTRKPTKPVMDAYEDWLAPQILSLVTDPKMFSRKMSELVCPRCGNHGLGDYPSTVACDCCGFHIPKRYNGYTLTERDIEQLVKFRYTSPIYGFINRKGRKFTQSLVLDTTHGVRFAPRTARIYS